jgi:ribosomal protein S18 acetylase RimI-like enzyme
MPDLAIRDYGALDLSAVVELWTRCGLTRPWNDPAADIALCLDSGHGRILVGEQAGTIVATIMVGHDGHRGWVYYLAVDPGQRGCGFGRLMMAAAEQWLGARKVPKLELMVRDGNESARAFYRRIGYAEASVRVMERWLRRPIGLEPRPRRIETTITYLEMMGPPPARTSSLLHGRIALLRLPKPSVPFYRFLYNTVGEPWFWYERRAMGDETLAAAIQAEGIELSVLYAEGEPAGYVEIDFRDREDVNLAYFGLLPGCIGRGLGSYLLSAALDEIWRRKPRRAWVHTCTLDHPRALRLYQKLGFAPYKQEAQIIDDPRDLGLIPPLTPAPPGAKVVAST